MNCCDYNCNQGRDCPARVAKVGRRTPDAEPLPPTKWRDYLGEVAGYVLISIVVAAAGTVIVVMA